MRVLVPLLCLLLSFLRAAFACRGQGVNISASAGVRQMNIDYGKVLHTRYSDIITVKCTGKDSKNLTMPKHEIRVSSRDLHLKLNQVFFNGTGLRLAKLPLGKYGYKCSDLETNCTEELTITVSPSIDIVSANKRYKYKENDDHYFVAIGEDYQVECSGNRKIEMGADGIYLQSELVNETTIKSEMFHESTHSKTYYHCSYYGWLLAGVYVHVDHPPTALNFWCIERASKINCTWSTLSEHTTFTLFYTHDDGNVTHLCKNDSDKMRTINCGWSLETMRDHGVYSDIKLSFIMESCNHVYCANQTHLIDRRSIQKLETPVGLKLLETTSHGAVLTWNHETYFKSNSIESKVTFRMPGIDQREMNAWSSIRNCPRCDIELKLPCPGALYQLKMYVKLTSTPRTKDEYWSDPAYFTLRTDPLNTSTGPRYTKINTQETGTESVDTITEYIDTSTDLQGTNTVHQDLSTEPIDTSTESQYTGIDVQNTYTEDNYGICHMQTELVNNKERAEYDVVKLQRQFQKDGLALHEKIFSMKRKVELIKKKTVEGIVRNKNEL